MTSRFFEQPILNSPYSIPTRHHVLDKDGQPVDGPPADGRRRSELITPIPRSRKQTRRSAAGQGNLGLGDPEGLSTEKQEYNPTPIINEIRQHLDSWRGLRNPADWRVTPTTQQLLRHWRHHDFADVRPFFCQVEAAETVIWLTEVAQREPRYRRLWDHIKGANDDANPELLRLALKMATGSGKTTVMAMLIAWQTVNAVRSPGSGLFSRGFLIVTPGITIRDRLRVLLPDDADNYYRTREILPADMLPDIGKAKIVITNYHAFKRRETVELSKVGRAFLQGRGEPITTIESEGQMLQRACGELLALKNVVVINDEAHHCYRENADKDDEGDLRGEEKDEAKANNEAARLWISGIEALKRKVGVRAVYDLSATPFFLRGSGYAEGTLFPWTVSDFSLMDAIECGIVKLPRIPVADNSIASDDDQPKFRNLWEHIGKALPKMSKAKAGALDPLKLPPLLLTALYSLYDHYTKVDRAWREAGIRVPPVFIVVCSNTAVSKLIYEWISGWERVKEDGERHLEHSGHLAPSKTSRSGARVASIRPVKPGPHEDFTIGCRVLTQPVFLDEIDWIAPPADWASNLVSGRVYDVVSDPEGRRLWERLQPHMARGYELDESVEAEITRIGGERFGQPVLVKRRLGQGAFRLLVTDVYERKCAVTRGKVLPALDVAHIRPYADGGAHQISNGLLLRRDVHTLLDRGYVTIEPSLRFVVSNRVKTEFNNGEEYRRLHGRTIFVPDNPRFKPDAALLDWHNRTIFRD